MTAETEKIQPTEQNTPENDSENQNSQSPDSAAQATSENEPPIVDPPENSTEKPSSPADNATETSSTDNTPNQQSSPDHPDLKELPSHLERILGMKIPVIIKIAQKKMHVREILKLNLGTVLQFDQDAYQHVDLMVNNSTIGLGQTVKVGENFGLKITQIGDINETIKSLGHPS